MRNYITYLYLLLTLLCSCSEQWDAYYLNENVQTTNDGASENLLQLIEQKPSHSKFLSLLKETGIDKELEKKQILTVWLPSDATYPAEQIAKMSLEDKKTLCMNHINYIALYNTKLSDGKLIKTLAGKNLYVCEPSMDEFTIDGLKVTKLNSTGTNGVIHEIDGWLVQRLSIYDRIVRLGDDYSIFRDTLLSWSDTLFKPSLSFPLDVDELGNTIYDSVFQIYNPLLLGKADLRNEDTEHTLFLPTNKVISEMFKSMEGYFNNMGIPYTRYDSTKYFNWLMRSVIHADRVDNYIGTLKSAHGNDWRTDKQLVEGEKQELSNGVIYNVSKLHVPRYLYLKTIQIYLKYLESFSSEELSDYLKLTNHSAFRIFTENSNKRKTLWVDATSKSKGIICEFMSVTQDENGKTVPLRVTPGQYKISASHRSWLCGNVRMSINNEVVRSSYNAGASATYDYKSGLVANIFEIKEEWGENPIWIKYEDIHSPLKRRIVLEYVLLEPTSDNY